MFKGCGAAQNLSSDNLGTDEADEADVIWAGNQAAQCNKNKACYACDIIVMKAKYRHKKATDRLSHTCDLGNVRPESDQKTKRSYNAKSNISGQHEVMVFKGGETPLQTIECARKKQGGRREAQPLQQTIAKWPSQRTTHAGEAILKRSGSWGLRLTLTLVNNGPGGLHPLATGTASAQITELARSRA